MRKLIAIAMCAATFAATADEWVKSVADPVSGDEVVINDKTYVLMSRLDFDAFTNKVAFFASIASKRWEIQHKSESGRTEWHGQRVNTTITTNDVGQILRITEYADGYRYTETFGKVRPKAVAEPPHVHLHHHGDPATLKALRERRQKRKDVTK